MAKKWFAQTDEGIIGPFTQDDIQRLLHDGQLLPQHLIWRTGHEKWVSLKNWIQENTSGGLTPINEDLAPPSWHYAYAGQSFGPLTRENLIVQLGSKENLGELMIWVKGMREWASIFEFHDLLTELGVNKRQFPRLELTGKVVLKDSDSTKIAPLNSISEGGFGIGLDSGIVVGQVLNVELQASQFREPIHAKAEVRYIFQGYAGLKFTQLSHEHHGAIVQLVKQNSIRFPVKAAA